MSARLTIRITAPLLLLSLLLLAAALATAWYVQQLHRNASEILASNVASMRTAEELEIGLREVRSQLDRFLVAREREHLERIPALRRETDRWLDEAERLATTEREQVLMVSIKRGYEHFFQELDRIARQIDPEDVPRQTMRRLIDQVLTEEILPPVHDYLDWNEELAAQGSAENRQTAHWLVFALLLLGVCGPAAGVLAGLAMARRVNRSLVRLSLPIRDAAGKLNEVVGPVTLAPGWGLEELEVVVGQMAGQIGAVIERLQQSQREALRAEQLAAVGQLAAGVAHELRNPLMSMKILVQSAAEGGGPVGLVGRDLGVLEEEISRLEQLTSAFLDFARPPQVERRVFEARALAEDAVDLVSGRAGQQDVRIDCVLPVTPLLMAADAGQVRQVLLNLLLNALDATAQGGTVRLELVACSHPALRGAEPLSGVTAPGRWLALRVADTGPGLPAGLGQDIFAPFVSTKQTGIGLGLSICKRIVEAHGGQIVAGNRPEGGAEVTVWLPCRWEHECVPALV